MNCIWIVVPCYNEEEVLNDSAQKLSALLKSIINKNKISADSKIVFINDGSTDSTSLVIDSLCESDSIFAKINLSRNFGHQNALLAGLMVSKDYADAAISIDADLQDDIGVIEDMIDNFISGDDIVYGVRSSRKADSFFKKFTAESFYKFMNLMGVELVFNHADFRLMSKRAIEGLSQFDEVNLFLRGIMPQIGYKSSEVKYERKKRLAGESKYPLNKMISFALEGITSFSVKPLKAATTLGIISLIISLGMLVYCFISKFTGNTVAGWASIGASLWAIGGLQLFMLGVIGEYIGKIYLETKHRPRYIIESIIINKDKQKNNP